MSVEIETIGIDVDGTKIILDKEAARELYFKLKELFGDKTPTSVPYPVTYPVPVYPTYPTYPWTVMSANTTACLSNYSATVSIPNYTISDTALLTYTW